MNADSDSTGADETTRTKHALTFSSEVDDQEAAGESGTADKQQFVQVRRCTPDIPAIETNYHITNQVRQRAATVAKDRIITFAKGPLGMRIVKDADGNW